MRLPLQLVARLSHGPLIRVLALHGFHHVSIPPHLPFFEVRFFWKMGGMKKATVVPGAVI